MSRRDSYHNIVKRALIDDGWIITHDPYTFDWEDKLEPTLSTDLGAERTIGAERGVEKIAVEVKSFLSVSQIVDLQKAIGQYVIYRALLRKREPERVIYLAVPSYAFYNILATEVGKAAIEAASLKLIVFFVEEEKELLWRTE
ncbi:MAG: hypothetical protein KDE19_06720 [Caldilineaceae bacterium]|nr:hypothetical protein [Caldilineaceae bacterium]